MPSYRYGRIISRFFYGLLLLFVATPAMMRAQQKEESQIHGRIDMGQTTQIAHSTHPLLRMAVDQGELASNHPMNHMLLVFQPSAAKQAALQQFLDDQQNPRSANYHHWLTAAQFGEQFGPSKEDIQTVSAWLTGQGMTVNHASASGGWLDFSGSASNVSTTFKTSMHSYKIKGESHVANATDISIPAALSSLVKGVVRLNDIYTKAPIQFSERIKRDKTGKITVTSYDGMHDGVPAGKSHPAMTDGVGGQYLTPGDLAQIYDAASLNSNGTDGTGTSIAILGRSNVQLSDMRAFRQLFQLPANDPEVILVGPDPGTGSPDEEESALDLEYAGALAPKATIKFVTAQSTDTADGIDLAAAYAVDNIVAPIISLSYGNCEAFMGVAGNQYESSLWQQAAAEGISVVVSTGDNGSASCDSPDQYSPAINGLQVSGIASTPYNTAVGGTMFDPSALGTTFWSTTNQANFTTALGYVPEKVWNEGCDPAQPVSITGNCVDYSSDPDDAYYSIYAGAGGKSSCTQSTQTQNPDGSENIQCISGYAKPSWQSGPGVPTDGARDIPDVSLAAASIFAPYTICVEGSCQTDTDSSGDVTLYSASFVGGTSASTPTFAGIVSLLNQTSGHSQGLLNYKLYQIASSQDTASCNSSLQTNPSSRGSCVFHDITSGNNAVPCVGGTQDCSVTDPTLTGLLTGYDAGVGYDRASGLGSIDVANLVTAWSTVTTSSSVTTLTVTPTSASHGQSIQVSGTVAAAFGSAIPTGQVSLQTNAGQAFGPFALTNGVFSASINSLPGGTYTLVASYPGDATFSASTSTPTSMTVSPENSATTVQVLSVSQTGVVGPGATSYYGDSLLLRADVAGASGHGTPTGNVTLLLDGTALGTFPVNPEGSVELYTGSGTNPGIFPGVGTHTLTATFAGDSSFNSSKSSSTSFTVNKGQTVTSIGSTKAYTGQQMMLYIFVLTNDLNLPLYPTGTVQVFDNGTLIATVPLESAAAISSGGSMATIPYTFTTSGSHKITASYAGDANFDVPSYNDSVTLNVTDPVGVPTALSVTTTSMQPTLGEGATFTITVAPKTGTTGTHIPSGTISINGYVTASVPSEPVIYGGVAFYNITFSRAGAMPLYFTYSGDSYYAASTSEILPVQVQQIAAPLVLTPATTQALPGSQVAIQAVLTGSTTSNALPYPSGQVQFYDSVNGASAVPLGQPHMLTAANGSAAYITAGVTILSANLPVGKNVVTAMYLGDTNYAATRSAATTITVSNPDFSVVANPTSVMLNTGSSATAMLQVQPVLGFSGAINLSCDPSTVPVGVQCSISPSTLPSGSGSAVVTLNARAATTQHAEAVAPGTGMIGISLASCLGIFLIVRRKRPGAWVCLALLVCSALTLTGCGGAGIQSTTVSLTSSSAKAAAGSTVTYSASVSTNGSSALTGSVTFTADGKQLGQPAALVSGVARLDSSILPVGIHTITATFNGDAHHSASTSSNIFQAITGSTSINLIATSSSITHTVILPIQLQ